MRVLICALAGVVGALAPAPAGAAELLLAQPSACAIGDELAFRAERGLGQPLDTAANVRCTVFIRRQGAGFAAQLELVAPGSGLAPRQRSFEAPTCEKLTETLALAVVLAVGSAPEPATAPAVPAVGPVPPTPSTAPTAAAPAEAGTAVAAAAVEPAGAPVQHEEVGPRLRWGARAALVGDAGSVPAGLGAMLGVAVGGESLEARLLGTYLPPREVSIQTSAPGSPGADLGLAAGSLLGCAPRLVRAGRLELGVCAGAELGWVSGNGTDLTVSRQGGALWSAARAELGARWALGPEGFALELGVGALVPLSRPEFSISGPDGVIDVYRSGAIAGRASAGISLEL